MDSGKLPAYEFLPIFNQVIECSCDIFVEMVPLSRFVAILILGETPADTTIQELAQKEVMVCYKCLRFDSAETQSGIVLLNRL